MSEENHEKYDLFPDSQVIPFKEAIRQSRYFLELVNRVKNGGNFPMYRFSTKSTEYALLFNINLARYLWDKNSFADLHRDGSIYKEKFDEGWSRFEERYGNTPPMSHKTWNGFSYVYNTVIKKELLDERTEFTEEEIQQSFYISGLATRQYEFEEEHSIIVVSYFMLESANSEHFPFARIPVTSRYDNLLPDSKSTKNSKVNLKMEFILLKELGYIDDLVRDRAKIEVATAIAEKINKKYSSQFLVDRRNIQNIQNILSADAYSPDHTNVKSAYKKQNIKQALLNLSKMGVSLAQCKYLSILSVTEPKLFE